MVILVKIPAPPMHDVFMGKPCHEFHKKERRYKNKNIEKHENQLSHSRDSGKIRAIGYVFIRKVINYPLVVEKHYPRHLIRIA